MDDVPSEGASARLVYEDGLLVATGETVVDDEMIYAILDDLRRLRDEPFN